MTTAEERAAPVSALLLALDQIATAVFVLDGERRIVQANRAGRLMLEQGNTWLRPAHSGIRLRRRPEDRAMEAGVRRVLEQEAPELLRLIARTGEAGVLLRMVPVPGEGLVVLGVSELRGRVLQPPGWSVAAFGLTRQGAELAERMAEGLSLAEIAERTELSIGALRTRLKKLLARTGARSQPALVSILLRGAAIQQTENEP